MAKNCKTRLFVIMPLAGDVFFLPMQGWEGGGIDDHSDMSRIDPN